jgi:hypothetical protein
MRNGTVELPSGLWDWTIQPGLTGAVLVLHHRTRPRDRMNGWIETEEAGEQEIWEAARQPTRRVWEDATGNLWNVETRLDVRQEQAPFLAFERDTVHELRSMPVGSNLGELTHLDLERLLAAREEPGRDVPGPSETLR